MPDSAYSEWLQSRERRVVVDDAAQAARWGDRGVELEVSSAIAVEANATAEGTRQIAFVGGPLVEEQIVVPKLYDIAALRGRTWTIKIVNDVIYGAGVLVYVLGGGADHGAGITRLDVLRRL